MQRHGRYSALWNDMKGWRRTIHFLFYCDLPIWGPILLLQTFFILLILCVQLNRNAGCVVWSVLICIVHNAGNFRVHIYLQPLYIHNSSWQRWISALFGLHVCVLIAVYILIFLSIILCCVIVIIILSVCVHDHITNLRYFCNNTALCLQIENYSSCVCSRWML